MNKRFLSFVVAVVLTLTSTMTVCATESEGEELLEEQSLLSNEVQAAYDVCVEIQTAIENKDIEAFKTAIVKLEPANENLSEEQSDELAAALGDDLWSILFSASVIDQTSSLRDAFLENKNVKTAKEFVEYHDILYVEESVDEEFRTLLEEMMPDLDAVYEEASANMPTEAVLKVFAAYENLKNGLEVWTMDEFNESYKGFEAVLDSYNELTEEEFSQLAVLLELEDAEAVFNVILSDWIDASILYTLKDLQVTFENDPTVENAEAYIEYYDSVYNDPEINTGAMKERLEFNIWGEEVYNQAKELLAAEAAKDEEESEANVKVEEEVEIEEEIEEEPEEVVVKKDAAPKTGDSTTIIFPVIGMLVAAAAVYAVKKEY